MSDPYQTLGVPPRATDEEIRRAYRQLVRKYHPDVYTGDPKVAAATTRALTEARDLLLDPVRREELDRKRTPADDLFRGPPPSTEPVRTVRPGSRIPYAPPSEWAEVRARRHPGPRVDALHLEELAHPRRWPAAARRIYQGMSRRQKILAVLLVGLVILVALLTLVPVPSTFSVTVLPLSLVGAGNCEATEALPWETQVRLAWTGGPGFPGGWATPPYIEVQSPAGSVATQAQAWNGTLTFTSIGGTYAFVVVLCAIELGSVTFTGSYSAPLV